MAAAVMGSDIDSFIREQKAKLASERTALNDGEGGQTSGVASRRQWDRQAGRGAPIAVEESRPRTQESGLPLNNSRSALKQQELAEQRKREYNELIKHDRGARAVHLEDDEISNPSIIPFNRADEDRQRKRRMEEERQREYQQMKARLEENHRRGRSQASERLRAPALPEQRRADRGSLLEQTDEYKAKLPGMNDSDFSKQIERERQRNEEYNQYLRENDVGRRTRASDRDQGERNQGDSEYYATLPGLRDSQSAKVRKEVQRNREYNEFLASRSSQRSDGKPPVAPRKGWATPTYEDILDKKREEEAQYRRAHDPGYGQPLELDSRVRQSRELDTKGPLFGDEGLSRGILDDPNWLSPSRMSSGGIYHGQEGLSRLQDFNYNTKTREPIDPPRNVSRELPRNVTPPQPYRTRESPREKPSDCYATLPIGSDSTGRAVASKPSGPLSSEEAKRRQKEQYRQELQKQMREVAEGRKREKQARMNINYSGEKQQDMSVDYSGYKDPEERKVPVLPLGNGSRQPPPPRSVQQPYYPDGLDKLDQLNTRADVSRGRQRRDDVDRNPSRGLVGGGLLDTPFSLSRGGGAGGGLLDTGFSSLLEVPRHSGLAPPPGLEYQPASFITQGGGGLGQTSVEDAYNFYATHNPLDNDLPVARAGGGGAAVTRPLQTSQDRAYTGRGGGGEGGGGGGGGAFTDRSVGGRSRVRFEDEGPRRLATMDFPNDDDKKREAQKKVQAYQEELNRQIEEKKRKKMQEKEEKERYDRKLEQEALYYNPYGRGGGGAPMRDADGNIISDLRSMHRDADNPNSSRRPPPPPPNSYPSQYNPSAPSAAGTRDDLFGPPPVQTTADGEQSHARGGHGIFGLPKTSEEKQASEKYKDDLRKQIEERKLEELRRKEMERQEEEREQQRLDEQRQRMQLEYEEEQRKLKEKEEEARKKNEELVREAEERKREAERRRKEAEDKRLEEERRQKEEEMNARLANVERGKSPVIPALRNKSQETEGNMARGKSPLIPTLRNKNQETEGESRVTSPPVPAARTRAAEDDPVPSTSKEEPAPVSRAASADVLNQLAVMRRQLQSERQRVEEMLETEKKPPEVFDPRLVQKPPPGKVDVDVFETARLGNAVAVRRTPGDRTNPQNAEDFNALKHKEDSDSRKEFRKLFPNRPSSGDGLEAQQAALIRQQEQNLHALREQRENGLSGYPKPSLPLQSSRGQARTPQQLTSNSAFVDVDGLNYFPDDFDDMPNNRRNESARARRRSRLDLSPRPASRGIAPDPFGSSTSLNVVRLAKKNEDRLKRLRELQGDDMSLYDPDDVLDRFMSKQSQHRPPSGQTLHDDSWLLTGAASKAGY